MAGSNWQQLAGGSVNPYDIRRDDGTPTANYGEHIICDGGTVTLPSASANEAVLVSNISQDTTVTTLTGLVEQKSDVTHLSSVTDPVLFVSDGSDWYVANNLDYLSTTPDSQDLYARYDYNEASTLDSLTDQTGSGRDLTGGPISGFGSRNGLQTGVFDGSAGQDMEGTFATSVSNPWHLFFTAQHDDPSSGSYTLSSPNSRWGFQSDSGTWEIFASSNATGDASDSNWHVFDILLDSNGDYTLRVDGVLAGIDSASAGSDGNSLSAFEIGDWNRGGFDLKGSIGEVLFYSKNKTSVASDIRSYLNRWI